MTASPLRVLRADAARWMAWTGAVLFAVLLSAVAEHLVDWAQFAAALVAYAVLAAVAFVPLAAHLPHPHFGLANTVTLARGALTATLAGLLFGPLNPEIMWISVALALVCIALDGLDGALARAQATISPFGARFDMEVDALLILTVGLLLVASGQIGAWILLCAAARYIFVAAGWLLPALQGALPHSERRRIVCVVQGATLALALIPALPTPLASALAGVGFAATAYSFAIDTLWLLRTRAEHA